MRFRAKKDGIKDLGLVSKKAIKKVKATRPTHIDYSSKHVFYEVDEIGDGKRRAKETNTKYFK